MQLTHTSLPSLQIGRKMRERSLQREEAGLLSDLSMGLRAKVAHAINHSHLKKVPFFSNFEDGEFISKLCMGMTSVYVSAGEEISREGNWADAMYIIVSGSVEVLRKEMLPVTRDIGDVLDFISDPSMPQAVSGEMREVENSVALLGANDFWGDSSLLDEKTQLPATMKAVAFSEMRVLSRETFHKAAQNFPKARDTIRQLSNRHHERDLESEPSEEGPENVLMKEIKEVGQRVTAVSRNMLSLLSAPMGSASHSDGPGPARDAPLASRRASITDTVSSLLTARPSVAPAMPVSQAIELKSFDRNAKRLSLQIAPKPLGRRASESFAGTRPGLHKVSIDDSSDDGRSSRTPTPPRSETFKKMDPIIVPTPPRSEDSFRKLEMLERGTNQGGISERHASSSARSTNRKREPSSQSQQALLEV